MRIVLVNLPWFKNGRMGVRAGSRWPFTSLPEPDGRIHYIPFPFFLAYSAALLEKEGHDVLLIDAIAQELGEGSCVAAIKGYGAQLVVVETSMPSFDNDIRQVEMIKACLPGAKYVLCGPHAGEFAEEILREHSCVDYILCGEYEQALLAVASRLNQGLGLADVAGVGYRDGVKVSINKGRFLLDSLDSLPWPRRDVPVIYKYNDAFAQMPCPNVQMLASRGCPFHCNFCLWPQTIYKGAGYRKRNYRDVVDEMEYLIKQFHFKAVYFDDDCFNVDREYVQAICHEILKRAIKVPWAVMARADLMDEELLGLMSQAGLYAVKYGIESADEGILKRCGKNLDLNKARRMIKVSRDLGIKVHLTFCIGLPGESASTIQRLVDFIRQAGADSLQFSLATPFPGTAYYDQVVAQGGLGAAVWEDYDGNHKAVINTQEFNGEQLEKVKLKLERMFAGD